MDRVIRKVHSSPVVFDFNFVVVFVGQYVDAVFVGIDTGVAFVSGV